MAEADIEKIVEVGARALCPYGDDPRGCCVPPRCSYPHHQETVRDLLSALTAAGYAVLPREPTEEMIEAGEAGMWPTEDKSTAELMWRAMVEAFSPVKGEEK